MMALFEARGSAVGLGQAFSACDLALPQSGQQVVSRSNGCTVLRLGPRRAFILSEASSEAALGDMLDAAFAAVPDADVVLVSDMFTTLEITGEGALDVLAQGAPLDISEAAFPAGSGTGTELWGTTVVLTRHHSAEPSFQIIVERSYAGFIEDWLIVASGGISTLNPGVMTAPPPSWKPS